MGYAVVVTLKSLRRLGLPSTAGSSLPPNSPLAEVEFGIGGLAPAPLPGYVQVIAHVSARVVKGVPPPRHRIRLGSGRFELFQFRFFVAQVVVDGRRNYQRQHHRDQDSTDHGDGQRLQHL